MNCGLVSMFPGLALLLALASAEARVTRIEITKVEPAFEGQSFGAVGPFEHVTGRAHGEVDPGLPENSVIQDILLAPRNVRGMVEYTTDIDILRPADPAKSNKVLLFDVANRGRKVALYLFNADMGASGAGDGWLQRQGYTLIWFGWQADVLPGDGHMTLSVPIARNGDGSPITGLVRAEFIAPSSPATTLSLSSGWVTSNVWFPGLNHAAYPTISTDNRTPLADARRARRSPTSIGASADVTTRNPITGRSAIRPRSSRAISTSLFIAPKTR